jgi:hypothetical protein
MTSHEAVLQRPGTRQGMFEVSFKGIKAIGDMALWKKSDKGNVISVLLSLYGSEGQLRGIFSALATRGEITLIEGDNSLELVKGWDGHLRFKSWRIGYGKYHALVWNEDLISDCIMVCDPAKEVEAWEAFLQKKKVPFIREWTTRLVAKLVRDGLVEGLHGINLKGWLWTASDDKVCDLIVEEIYR